MTDKIEVIQKTTPLSETTQIGVQYIGMPIEKVGETVIEIFLNNFPKLQDMAKM